MTDEPAESSADIDEAPRRPGRAAAAAAGGTGVAAALLSVILEGHERDVALAVAHALGDPLIGQWPTIAIAAAAAVVAVAYGRKSNIRWRRQLRLAQRQEQAIEGLRQDLRDGLAGADARLTRAEGELRALVKSEVLAAVGPLADRVNVLERKPRAKRPAR